VSVKKEEKKIRHGVYWSRVISSVRIFETEMWTLTGDFMSLYPSILKVWSFAIAIT